MRGIHISRIRKVRPANVRPFWPALVLMTVCACNDSLSSADQQKVEEVKAAVLEELRDPGSAQFSNVRVVAGMVCGEVNAKNAFGGYAGKKHFWGGVPEAMPAGEAVVISTEDTNPCELLEKNLQAAKDSVG